MRVVETARVVILSQFNDEAQLEFLQKNTQPRSKARSKVDTKPKDQAKQQTRCNGYEFDDLEVVFATTKREVQP